MKKLLKKHWFWVISLIVAYLVSHLYGLTQLPVFSDESIYIRWSQLIIDEPARYLFFALNDGKTPLFVWLITPLLFVFKDPLFAGRFLSLIFGLFQMLAMGWLIKTVGGKKKTQIFGMILVLTMPFWFFHHRMALMDGILSFWLTLFVIGSFKVVQQKSRLRSTSIKGFLAELLTPAYWPWIFFTGISLGLAFWSKLPAVLMVPTLIIPVLLTSRASMAKFISASLRLGVAVFLGLIIFASLKIHPAFGQLFARGGDFLHPISKVLFDGIWKDTLAQWPNYLKYFGAYLGWPFIFLLGMSVFVPSKHKRTILGLSAMALIFSLPIMFLGNVVYPRYLMPAMVTLTPAVALCIEALVGNWINGKKDVRKVWLGAAAIAVLVANGISLNLNFDWILSSNPDQTPFVSADVTQYLGEWSSGHGHLETVEFLQQETQNQSIAVATEGSFGTLPDTLLMYLHRQDLTNITVEGIGYPVKSVPEWFNLKSQNFDRVWLVVNSHRMLLPQDNLILLKEYCRPHNAPCLQVWDVTDELDNLTVWEVDQN